MAFCYHIALQIYINIGSELPKNGWSTWRTSHMQTHTWLNFDLLSIWSTWTLPLVASNPVSHVTNDFLLAIPILWKVCITMVCWLSIESLQYFTYAVRETNACPLATASAFWAGQVENRPWGVEFCAQHTKGHLFSARVLQKFSFPPCIWYDNTALVSSSCVMYKILSLSLYYDFNAFKTKLSLDLSCHGITFSEKGPKGYDTDCFIINSQMYWILLRSKSQISMVPVTVKQSMWQMHLTVKVKTTVVHVPETIKQSMLHHLTLFLYLMLVQLARFVS